MPLKHIFFWGSSGPFGCFSNWFHSEFVDDNNVRYSHVEQYMMYHKALTFDDKDTALEVLGTKCPKECKSLGRKVKNFNNDKWDLVKYHIVASACYLKFNQNEEIRKILLSTGDLELVEASPYDRIWGIGFFANEALQNVDKWGANLLGKCLMEAREILDEQRTV